MYKILIIEDDSAGRNVFQIVIRAPVDRRAVDHDDGPVRNAADDVLGRHGRYGSAIRSHAGIDDTVEVLQSDLQIVRAGLLDLLFGEGLRRSRNLRIGFLIPRGRDDD